MHSKFIRLFSSSLCFLFAQLQLQANCNPPQPTVVNVINLGNDTYQADWVGGTTSLNLLQWGITGCEGEKGGGEIVVSGNTGTFNPYTQGSINCTTNCPLEEIRVVVIPICTNGEFGPYSNLFTINQNCGCEIANVDLALSFCHWGCNVCDGGDGHVCVINQATGAPVDWTFAMDWGNSMVYFPTQNCTAFPPEAVGSFFTVVVTDSEGCTATLSQTFECEPVQENPFEVFACPTANQDIDCNNCNMLCIQVDDGSGNFVELGTDPSLPFPTSINWSVAGAPDNICINTALIDGDVITVEITYAPNTPPQVITYMVNCGNLQFTAPIYEHTVHNHKDISIPDPAGDILIYPNPTSDIINISYPKTFNNATMEILTIDGKVIHSASALTKELNLSHLATGLYYLRMESKEGIHVQKFVKH